MTTTPKINDRTHTACRVCKDEDNKTVFMRRGKGVCISQLTKVELYCPRCQRTIEAVHGPALCFLSKLNEGAPTPNSFTVQ